MSGDMRTLSDEQLLDELFGSSRFRQRARISMTFDCPFCGLTQTHDFKPYEVKMGEDYTTRCARGKCWKVIRIGFYVMKRYGAPYMLWGRGVLDGRRW